MADPRGTRSSNSASVKPAMKGMSAGVSASDVCFVLRENPTARPLRTGSCMFRVLTLNWAAIFFDGVASAGTGLEGSGELGMQNLMALCVFPLELRGGGSELCSLESRLRFQDAERKPSFWKKLCL